MLPQISKKDIKKDLISLILLSLITVALTSNTKSTNSTSNKIKINPTTKFFEDKHGRSIIYHGVNVVYKQLPYIPITDKFDPFLSLNDQDIDYMKKMGFNIVRLGVIWESVEREEGKYDMEYLKKMANIVNELGKNGIVSIVDAHQDMFSRIYCGEGVPIFYAKKINVDTKCDTNLISQFFGLIGACMPLSSYNWKYDDNGVPLIDYCRKNFLKYHQSPELTSAYEAFYNNEFGLMDKFIDFWRVVANEFKQNDYVIGLDFWNEPWAGNLFMNPTALIPGYVDKNQLGPFYRKLDKAVREYDSEFISMYEPVPFPDTIPYFGGQSIGNFDEVPLHDVHKKYQALNMHSYCCMAKTDACDTGEPLLKDTLTICPDFHNRKLKKNKAQADKLGIPLIITEFGACSNTEACFNEISALANAADENLVGWAYWMYKPYNDHTTTARQDEEGIFRADGTMDPFKEKALTRTYIQAYQGVPLYSKFDTETGFYFSTFEFNKDITENSRLYFNRNLFYKNFTENFSVRLFNEDNEDISFELSSLEEKEENYMDISINEKLKNNLHKKNINFSITPKSKINMEKYNKKIKYNISNSPKGLNSLKFLSQDKKTEKNLRINMSIEFSKNLKSNLTDKNDNIIMNKEYLLSEKNIFVRNLVINFDLGELRIENLFNNEVEIYLD